MTHLFLHLEPLTIDFGLGMMTDSFINFTVGLNWMQFNLLTVVLRLACLCCNLLFNQRQLVESLCVFEFGDPVKYH